VDTYEGRNLPERPAGADRRVALATSGSTKFRRMPTLYTISTLWRSEIASGHGAERRSLGLRDDDDGDDYDDDYDDEACRLVSKIEGKTIGADTVLKLGAQTPARSARNFFSVPPKFALCPPPNSRGTAGA